VNRIEIRFKIVQNHSTDRFLNLRGKCKEKDKREGLNFLKDPDKEIALLITNTQTGYET
jgi:hypothetical protein